MCSSAVGLVTAKVTSFQTTRSRCLWLAGICVVLLAGCAGTPPTLPGDRKRVAQKIKARIDARKVPNTASSEPHSFQVVLLAGLGQIPPHANVFCMSNSSTRSVGGHLIH